MVNPKVFIGNSDGQRPRALRAAFEYVGLYGEIGRSTKIFVKPNFTYPKPVPGVTTSRGLLTDALRLLGETGAEVFVGESNGGYGSFLASESFVGHALPEICRQTGTTPLDLSQLETEEQAARIGGKLVSVRLPRFLLKEIAFTVSIPVLKVHAMTTVSLSMKNLWGCYPTDLRLLEHRELDRKLTLISRLTKARFGIVDALYGLDGHGPMEGEARRLGKFVASNDLMVLDVACARMMGFNPRKILHLRNLLEFANGTRKPPAFESNEDLTKYKWDFQLSRNMIDSLSFACFHSDLLAKVVFDSPFTTPIYSILRRKPRRRLS
jgi:uncharacterized protein (DUF362 family)